MPRSDAGDATRERILEGAERLFSAYGYDGVSVAQIAEAADVSPANIYHHYADKQTLYDTLIERALAVFSIAFEGLRGEGTPRVRIERVVDSYVGAIFDHAGAIGLLIDRVRRPLGASGDPLLPGAAAAIDSLAAVIAEGVDTGEFSPVDPAMAAEALFGMMNIRIAAMALDSPGGVDETDPKAVAAFISSLFFEGVCSC